MSKLILLGATKKKEIAFSEFEIRTWNGYPEFSAMFCTVKPFRVHDVDLESYFDYEDLKAIYGDEWVLSQLESRGCTASDLSDELIDEIDDVSEVIDCSYFGYTYEISGEEWKFESVTGGQHDLFDEMEVYVNKEDFLELYSLWKKYHIKKVPIEIENQVKNLEKKMIEETKDYKEWIINYIKENLV